MDNQSIQHTRLNCTYHIVFIPKCRRMQIATENGQQGHIFRPVWDMPPVGNNYSTVFLT